MAHIPVRLVPEILNPVDMAFLFGKFFRNDQTPTTLRAALNRVIKGGHLKQAPQIGGNPSAMAFGRN